MKKHSIKITLLTALLLSVSTSVFAEDAAKPAAPVAEPTPEKAVQTGSKVEAAKKEIMKASDPFTKWYKPNTQLIAVPETYTDSARDLIKSVRSEFKKQINALPETEWASTKVLAGNKTQQEIDAILKVKLSPDNDTGNKAEMSTFDGTTRTFEHGADAASYKLGTCAWHFYFLSMQAKDDKTRTYTEASTKVLISAATSVSEFASQYDTDTKKFDADRNDKSIWQAMLDTEQLVYKMADATKDKKEADQKKYKDIFDSGTKKCQADGAPLAAMVLLKANGK